MPALIFRRALWRGVMFWIGLRLLQLLIGGVGSLMARGPVLLGTDSHPILISAIVAALAWYDVSRRNEVTFLANLGIGIRGAIALYVAPAFLLELLPVVLG